MLKKPLSAVFGLIPRENGIVVVFEGFNRPFLIELEELTIGSDVVDFAVRLVCIVVLAQLVFSNQFIS